MLAIEQAGHQVVLVQVIDLLLELRGVGGGANQYLSAGLAVIAGA
jgi:hypothetical protein